MRQLNIKVEPEKRDNLIKLLDKLKAKNIVEVTSGDKIFFEFYLDNRKVQDFFEMNEAQEAEIVLNPHGVLPMHPPSDQAPGQVVDVSMRSPVEIFLSGLQSIGSWGSLIGYAIASAVVAFIGLYTDVIFLLTASMLIAPFAGPVMNAALAGAAGELTLLGNSLFRYVVAIFVSVVASFLLSLLMKIEVLPPLADSLSRLSHINLLLPLFAGFAGALSIINSERNNLVSGAGVGILVAASLAPPAVILGMTIYTGGVSALLVNLYKLLLQMFGIQLAASLVFRYWGKVNVKGARFHKGRNSVFVVSLVLTLTALIAMGYLQYNDRPLFQRTYLAYEVNKTSSKFFSEQKKMQVIDFEATVTDEKSEGRNITYCQIILYSKEGSPETEDMLGDELVTALSKKFPELLFVAKVTKLAGD